MRIKYHNVGSIKDAEVEYKPGQLIAIVGESNQGKSLQFYSLLSGFTNTTDFKRFINNEALAKDPKSFESIELIDDNGDSWSVTASQFSMTYKAKGIKYEKPGRKSIFELTGQQIPGLLYDAENCTPIMNIVDEDTGMFPIDRSDSQIFKTYERLLSLSCTEDILNAIKLDIEDIDYNVAERLKSIQQNQANAQKISEFLNSIDEKTLLSTESTLRQLLQKYTTATSIYDRTEKTANYINAVDTIKASWLTFDIASFQKKLELLIFANKALNYCNLVEQIDIKKIEDFDIQKAINAGQDLSVAMQLIKDISLLEQQIQGDEKLLNEVTEKLNQIKICPLCGHKLED